MSSGAFAKTGDRVQHTVTGVEATVMGGRQDGRIYVLLDTEATDCWERWLVRVIA